MEISENHVESGSLNIDDVVVYKPFKDCRNSDISGKGIVIGIIDDYTYRVRFGFTSMHGTRDRNYNYSNLYKVNE